MRFEDRVIRRQFIAGVMVAAAALTLRLGSTGRQPSAAVGEDPGALGALFREPESARAIGRRYLQEHPNHKPLAEWWRDTGLTPHQTDGAAQAFRTRREEDFRRGRTVLIDGWLLARAELSACVLLALDDVCIDDC